MRWPIQWIFLGIATLSYVEICAVETSLQGREVTRALLEKVVVEALDQFQVPGAAVGVVVGDQVVLVDGYGMRNAEKKLPVTQETLFAIGSCTKAFTAQLFGQLAQEGKISLDEPVCRYLPQFRLWDAQRTIQVTLRDLLAHRSGIARHDALWVFCETSPQGLLKALENLEPACGLREEFQYNNALYAVAAMVFEKVEQKTWDEALALRIFDPLEMKRSTTFVEKLEKSDNFSLPYAEIKGEVRQVPFCRSSILKPGGGINSTIGDMVKWVQFQLKNPFQEAHRMQMPLNRAPSDQEEIHQYGYGLGWFVGDYRGHSMVRHGGHIDGFCSEVCLLPQERLGIVILTNSSSDGDYLITFLRNFLFDLLLNEGEGKGIKEVAECRNQAKCLLQKVNQEKVFIACLQPYVGTYEHPAYGSVAICLQGEELQALYGSVRIPLSAKSETLFVGQLDQLLVYGAAPFVEFSFLRTASGEISGLKIPFEGFRGASPIIFKRRV